MLDFTKSLKKNFGIFKTGIEHPQIGKKKIFMFLKSDVR